MNKFLETVLFILSWALFAVLCFWLVSKVRNIYLLEEAVSKLQVVVDSIAARITAAVAQQEKAYGEIAGEIAGLKAQAEAGEEPDFAGIDAALAALGAVSQQLDDIVPDVEVAEELVSEGTGEPEVAVDEPVETEEPEVAVDEPVETEEVEAEELEWHHRPAVETEK